MSRPIATAGAGDPLVAVSTDEAVERASSRRGRLAAAAFVVVWCTGYPAGKIAVQHGGPFTILLLRFTLAAAIFLAVALLARASWPGTRALVHSAVVGLLSLALSFGGIYEGLRLGVSTGVSALFVGAMPLATAVIGLAFGERLTARQWLGLAFGFAGVILVLEGRLDGGHASGIGYLASAIGLLGLSLGTLYQKRWSSQLDLRIGLGVQHAAAALAMLPLAAFVEHFRTARRAIKAAALPDSDGIYAKAKAVELEAERLLQRQLAERAPPENVGLATEGRLADALANLALYVGDAPAGPIVEALKAMAETGFRIRTD